MQRISKFDYGAFFSYYPDERIFAVSMQRFSFEEAIRLYEKEIGHPKFYESGAASVIWRAGRDEDNERRVGWWLDFEHDGTEPRYCPVWIFRY